MNISKLLPAVCVFAFCASFGAVQAQDTPAQSAAREALLKQMGQTPAPAAEAPPVAPVPKPAPAPVAVVVVMTNTPPAMVPAAPTSPTELSAEEQAKARAALLEKMGATQSQQLPTSAAVVPVVTPAPAHTVKHVVAPTPAPAVKPVAAPAVVPAVAGEVPIVAPALPISQTKEQRLQSLLAKYKADQITPEQYFTQRAAILAEP